jgi:hypothetical protein
VRAHLVVLVLAMAAVFTAAVAALGRGRAADARAGVERRAVEAAHAVAREVDHRAGEVDAVLATLARAVRLGGAPGDVAFNDSLLAAVRADLAPSFTANLWVADSAGRVIGTSHAALPARETMSAAGRRFFEDALRTGRPVIGDAVRSRPDTTRWSVGVARPVPGAGGRPRAVVFGTLQRATLRSALDVVRLPERSVIAVVDRNGVVLAHSRDADRWVGRGLPAAARAARSRPPAAGAVEEPAFDGVRRLGAYAAAPATGWSVYVGIPADVAFAELRATARRDALFGAAALAATLLVAGAIARRVTRPVAALVADVQAIAAGDLAGRPAGDPAARHGFPRELAALAAAHDEMADTIARRTAELHRSEQRYRQLFDASPLPMYLADLSTYRFLAVNDAALAQYGYGRDEFLSLTQLDIRPPEDRLRFLAVMRSLEMAQIRQERANSGVWRHVRRDGSTFEAEVFTAATEFEGRAARLIVASDITARLRAERALQESQEQLRGAQKMEALGRFAGGIAHDFNNILTGILGYCDLALADMPNGMPARDDVTEIRAAAQRAAGLTGRILAFSRGRVAQPRAVDLGGVARELEPMLRRVIGEHIHLQVSTPPRPTVVLGEAGQLEQVLLNLALNARDAMSDGGTLAVTTRDAAVEPDDPAHPGVAPGRYAVLEVRDTGHGMSADTQAHIFEPFFTTKERGKGTGLGLATVYGIARQAGGAVRVQSAPYRGSTFTVYLPLAEAGVIAEPPATAAAAPAPHGTETVLLVEDEDAVRAVARETLTRHGYTVLAASDGYAALAMARAHQGEIALVLSDVVMPAMGGRALAEQLARERLGIAVLLMSGYTEDDVPQRGPSGQPVAFIGKPFTPDALAAKVREVLDDAAAAGEPVGAGASAAEGGGA